MGVLITITNQYDNGVCDQYNIYTGTTYNIDNSNLLGTHSLPHSWDGGTYTGPLYVFVEHCDGHIDPPPSDNPKKQGGFQVKLLNIDCEQCPPNPTPLPLDCGLDATFIEMFTTDCNLDATFIELFTTDCDLVADFEEYFATDCDLVVNFEEYFATDCDIDATFIEYSNPTSTPNPTETPNPTPTATEKLDCNIDGTVVEFFEEPV